MTRRDIPVELTGSRLLQLIYGVFLSRNQSRKLCVSAYLLNSNSYVRMRNQHISNSIRSTMLGPMYVFASEAAVAFVRRLNLCPLFNSLASDQRERE